MTAQTAKITYKLSALRKGGHIEELTDVDGEVWVGGTIDKVIVCPNRTAFVHVLEPGWGISRIRVNINPHL